MAGADCVFCKIVQGQIPAEIVWQSPWAIAFLDINPANPGHVLLVLREHYATVDTIPPALFGSALQELPRLADAVMRATGAEGLNVVLNNGKVAGQVIDHVHFHLIPRRSGDSVTIRWEPGTYRDSAEVTSTAERIRAALSTGGQ